MKKFLFIVTSFWAYGELQIAIDFAMKVFGYGHEVMFLIPPAHADKLNAYKMKYRILIPNSAVLNRILLRDIEESYTPSFVVLSDFLNYAFCERHYGLAEKDLMLFSGLIGAFDLYNFAWSRKKIDTYGFRAKEMSNLEIENYDFLLQPCPVNRPVLSNHKHCFRYRLFDGIENRDINSYKESRDHYGVKSSEKIILMTGATWQSSFRPYENVRHMVTAFYDIISQIIIRLPHNFRVVWVGPRHKTLCEEANKVQYMDSVLPSDFEKLADSADVFISVNHISTSMIRTALRGIPVVLLGNSYLKRPGESRSLTGHKEPNILKDLDIVYPFRMFPVGWYSFLEPIVYNNLFYELTKYAEIFDVDEALNVIINAGNESMNQSQKNLFQYQKSWLALLSIEAIILSMSKIKKQFRIKDT